VPVLYLRAEDGVLFPQEGKPSTFGTSTSQQSFKPVGRQPGVVDKRMLRDVMNKAFSSGDLDILCSDIQESLRQDGIELQVNLDVIGGSSKPLQVLNLIEYLDRRGYLAYLEKAVREARPGII